MARVLKWIGTVFGVLLSLLLVLVLVLLFMDWNRLRGPLSNAVSQALGRNFAINGNLSVDWSWTPRIAANDIELANAPWGSRPEMFKLDRFEVAIRLPELFRGRIVLPEVRATRPFLILERSENGRQANWDFGEKKDEKGGMALSRRWIPEIGQLAIDDGRFLFRDPATDTSFDMSVSTVAGAASDQGVKITGRGRATGAPLTLDIRSGPILTLWKEGTPYPIEVRAAFGDTKAEVKGTFAEPVKLEGPDLRFEAEGPNLAALSAFSPAWIPETPPYRFAGRISRDGDKWLLRGFEGKLGSSDLSGDLMATIRNDRPYLEGDMRSRRFDFRDVVGIFGADPTPEPADKASPRLLPDKPYDLEGLRAADVDLRFQSGNIVTPWMPVDDLATHVRLDEGVITLDPVKLTVGYGAIRANIELDARGSMIQTALDAHIDKVPFKRLLAKTPFADETAGNFFGRTKLTMAGNSVAAMAASADGDIKVLMEDGRISGLLMEAAGLDVTEALGIALAGDDPAIRVRCSISDFIASDGVIKTQLFLMDTTDSQLLGDGSIDLRNETVDFRLEAKPKDFSLFAARTPVRIGGTLKKPRPRPEPGPLVAKGAASVVLGALLTPAAALLPWVELGLAEDSPCRALVEAAEKGEKLPGGKGKSSR